MRCARSPLFSRSGKYAPLAAAVHARFYTLQQQLPGGLLLLMLGSAVFSGCADGFRPDFTTLNPKTGKSETHTSAKEIQAGLINAFPDVPVPADHRIDLDRSLVFTSPRQTVGKLTTDGPGDVNSLFNFYQQQMTAKGWSLVNGFQTSTSSLYFAKPGKFVAIIIEPVSSRRSRVMLSIGPE